MFPTTLKAESEKTVLLNGSMKLKRTLRKFISLEMFSIFGSNTKELSQKDLYAYKEKSQNYATREFL